MAVLGIDVSKAEFHCALLEGAIYAEAKFDNKPPGFRKMLKWLKAQKAHDVHVCMEATGSYWRELANTLHGAQLRVSVVNPSRTALFARSLLRRTKTDAVDARMLADFCLSQKPDAWTPPPKETLELRAFGTYRTKLIEHRTAQMLLISQVEGNSVLRKIHAEQLEVTTKAIAKVDRALRAHIKQHRALQEQVAHLETIPSLGTLSASAIVAHLPIERLRDKKAAAAYAGLSPSERQSGTSLHGKSRICKTGNAELRRSLYMPALVAIQHNVEMKAFAARLKAKGKPGKVIIVAVMRKLLVLAYTLLRDKTDYVPRLRLDFQDGI